MQINVSKCNQYSRARFSTPCTQIPLSRDTFCYSLPAPSPVRFPFKLSDGHGCIPVLASLILLAGPAHAISGGKESVGIFKPLDDADLSGWTHFQVIAGQNLTKVQFVKGSLRRVNFEGSDLSGTSLFGAFCKDCSFKGATLRNTNLESSDLEGADFSNAILEGAMLTNAQLRANTITNSDWTDVLLRKDQLKYLCSIASGVNPTTGVDTRESLNCP